MIRANPEEPAILIDDFMSERRHSNLRDRQNFINEINLRRETGPSSMSSADADTLFNHRLREFDSSRGMEGVSDGYRVVRHEPSGISLSDSSGAWTTEEMPSYRNATREDLFIALAEEEEEEFKEEDIQWFKYITGLAYTRRKMRAHMNRLDNEVGYFNLWYLKVDMIKGEPQF